MLLIYILPLLINTLAVIVLIRAVAPFRHVPGAWGLMASVILGGIWSAGYAMELACPTLPAKLFWVNVQYVGITGISLAWLTFVFTYVAPPAWFSRQPSHWLALAVIPAITLILAWTNDLHGWIYHNPTLIQGAFGPILQLKHGPWFWVFFGYSQILMIVGSLWLFRNLVQSTRLHSWQIGTAMAGTLAPWLGNLVYVSQMNPIPYLDWTPFGFTAAGLLLAFSLFRFQLVKVVPIAHKMVVEEMADGVIILDLQGHIIDLNPAALKILDLPPRKLVGWSLTDFLPELASSFHTLDLAQPWQAELSVGKYPGRQTYEVRVSQLKGFSGLPFGRLVVLHNITQHKHEQFQLQKIRDGLEERVAERTQALMEMNKQLGFELTQRRLAEKRFEEIFHSVPDAILLVNPQGEILLNNSQAERLFGYNPQALFGLKIHSLVPDFYRTQHHVDLAQYFANPFRGPMKNGQEVLGRHSDGSVFPAEIILSPLKMTDGIMVACMIRDLRPRKLAEAALRESEETYRTLFENANDSIFLVSVNEDWLKINQKGLDMLGYTREELQAISVWDILAPEYIPEVREKGSALMNGRALPLVEWQLRTRDGESLPVEITLALVRDEQDEPKYIQAIVRDISERKKAESEQAHLLEEIRQSRENLRALASRLTEVQDFERRQIAVELHDRVGQNLTGLNLNLQVIRNKIPESPSLDPMSGRLEESIRLVEETTRQVRNVMADLDPPLLDEYGLFSALHWLCEKFSQWSGVKTTTIGEEFHPRLPKRVEMGLFRIVQEALTNVVKHAQADQVIIRLEEDNRMARVSVEDNGLGFNPEDVASKDGQPHWGLITIQERAASIGARLNIRTVAGAGTCIEIQMERDGDRGDD